MSNKPIAWRDQYVCELSKITDQREALHLAYRAIEDITGLTKIDLLTGKCFDFEAPFIDSLNDLLQKLISGMPYQYALGRADFYGLQLSVDSAVLIPRPETEELVKWILEDNHGDFKNLLDCCTGSGCIALALKNQRPGWEISACDISSAAISLAKCNSLQLESKIYLFEADVFNWPKNSLSELDILVSNPPYIRQSEAALMSNRVLDFEPHLALFVPDHDALLFYTQIAEIANQLLKKGGHLYFEINEALSLEVSEILNQLGFQDVKVRKDLNGRTRMVKARRA